MDETVLVGGCATGLLVTDTGAAPIRPTLDVDLVVDVVHYQDIHAFDAKLRARGFTQGPRMDEQSAAGGMANSGSTSCRWEGSSASPISGTRAPWHTA